MPTTPNLQDINYKDVEALKQFTDSYGRIISSRRSGITVKNQRRVANAIKRARFMGFLPYVSR